MIERFRLSVSHESDPTHDILSFDVRGAANKDRARYGLCHGFPRCHGYLVRCWRYDTNRNLIEEHLA